MVVAVAGLDENWPQPFMLLVCGTHEGIYGVLCMFLEGICRDAHV